MEDYKYPINVLRCRNEGNNYIVNSYHLFYEIDDDDDHVLYISWLEKNNDSKDNTLRSEKFFKVDKSEGRRMWNMLVASYDGKKMSYVSEDFPPNYAYLVGRKMGDYYKEQEK